MEDNPQYADCYLKANKHRYYNPINLYGVIQELEAQEKSEGTENVEEPEDMYSVFTQLNAPPRFPDQYSNSERGALVAEKKVEEGSEREKSINDTNKSRQSNTSSPRITPTRSTVKPQPHSAGAVKR
jgi:hypothetical protein